MSKKPFQGRRKKVCACECVKLWNVEVSREVASNLYYKVESWITGQGRFNCFPLCFTFISKPLIYSTFALICHICVRVFIHTSSLMCVCVYKVWKLFVEKKGEEGSIVVLVEMWVSVPHLPSPCLWKDYHLMLYTVTAHHHRRRPAWWWFWSGCCFCCSSWWWRRRRKRGGGWLYDDDNNNSNDEAS